MSKGPSVDDILSMDQVDDLPSEILVGQGKNVSAKGERSKTDTRLKSDLSSAEEQEEMETDVNIHDGFIDVKEKKTHQVKLSAPASQIHSRSSSLPVETADISSSQFKTVRTRSNSGDANNREIKDETVKTVRNETKGKGSVKSDDPFDFVGNMMAESKKDTHKSGNSGILKKKDYDATFATETEEPLPCKNVNQKQKRQDDVAVSAAKSFNQSARVTRGQRLKGQEQMTESDVCDGQVSNSSVHEYSEKIDSHNSDKSKPQGNMKSCGQEVSNKQHIENMTDEENSSQDNYEMDVSASPVY